MKKIAVVFCFLLLMLSCPMAWADSVPLIAAASDLKFALEKISQKFTQETGQQVKLSFGSSGNFFQQISQNAPFELFMSADEHYVLALAEKGLTVDKGALYAVGQLVLFIPTGSTLSLDANLKGVAKSLQNNQLKHFAIAKPDHAPYGRAAKQVLEAKGLWEKIQPKLVLGENVAQAAQFAVSGATDGGIFAYSLIFAPHIKEQGKFILLPENLYTPLHQRMVLLKNASPTAKAFYNYLQSTAARAVFKAYGFVHR